MKSPLFFLCAVLVGGMAVAQDNPDRSPGSLPAFSTLDANGDGVVTMAEFLAKLPPEFAVDAPACDTDGDKVLSAEEYEVCSGNVPATEEDPSR